MIAIKYCIKVDALQKDFSIIQIAKGFVLCPLKKAQNSFLYKGFSAIFGPRLTEISKFIRKSGVTWPLVTRLIKRFGGSAVTG